MVLIGLLGLALACLVIGLILASGIWLIASLVASAVAGYLLWRQREQLAARAGVHKDQAAPKTSATTSADETTPPTGTAGTAQSSSDPATSDDAKPAAAKSGGNPEQQVWVVDAMPQFHAEDCAAIQNLDSESIPLAQAIEDGFAECTVCKPDASTARVAQVWVVDGRPDYHVEDCRSLKIASTQQSRQPDQIPRGQAVDDGFSACPDCRPDGAAGADSTPAPEAPAATAPDAAPKQAETTEAKRAPASVWVVDGRPRYHLSDCMIIKDQQVEEISLEQATEDGFMACTMCEPHVTRV